MKRYLLRLFVILAPAFTLAQTSPATQAAREWRQQHERVIMDEFAAFLSIPNVAQDRENIRRNADFIAKMMERRGIPTRQVSVPGANPVVVGEIRTPGASRTIVFYAHYDGQPVDPQQWTTPPFTPTLRSRAIDQGGSVIPFPAPGTSFDPESRLYARAAGDDKVPIIAIVTALDAIRAAGMKAKSNVKFVFEGEEEAGSANLEKILKENKELFSGDLWLICDSPTHPSRRQQIVFGAPGLLRIDITVYGARVELHGGHYGNWAPNPALMLSRLLASMKDDRGRVLIKDFHDGIVPLSKVEKAAIAEAPDIDAQLLGEFGLGARVGAPLKLAELITLPVLNIRGISSARVGAEATSVVPTTAAASLNLAIMKGMDYLRTVKRIQEHVRAQGFFVVDTEPSMEVRTKHEKVAMVAMRGGGYNATRTPMDLPISQEVIRVVESARGPAVKLPTMGGALPLEMIERTLGTRTIIIPIANHDNNQHSFDENVRIQNVWEGIELMAALLMM
jgi:acetylornithine deacetylase/succinyl-diaminopimelate desuccinylase-like protein